MGASEIRILQPDDAEALFALRQAALIDEPLAFAASPEDDHASSVEAMRGILGGNTGGLVFGADDGGLVGMLGLYREPKRKMAHKINFWGMYVRPEARGQGIARRLLEAALDHSGSLDGVTTARISVTDSSDGARSLYEQLGFRVWGTEPDALRHNGRAVSECHMALAFRPGAD